MWFFFIKFVAMFTSTFVTENYTSAVSTTNCYASFYSYSPSSASSYIRSGSECTFCRVNVQSAIVSVIELALHSVYTSTLPQRPGRNEKKKKQTEKKRRPFLKRTLSAVKRARKKLLLCVSGVSITNLKLEISSKLSCYITRKTVASSSHKLFLEKVRVDCVSRFSGYWRVKGSLCKQTNLG